MKFGIAAIAAAALIASGSVALAQGASSKSPGHEMQEHGSKKGSPGASGYAPGQGETSQPLTASSCALAIRAREDEGSR
jgi:hypothetical protein